MLYYPRGCVVALQRKGDASPKFYVLVKDSEDKVFFFEDKIDSIIMRDAGFKVVTKVHTIDVWCYDNFYNFSDFGLFGAYCLATILPEYSIEKVFK